MEQLVFLNSYNIHRWKRNNKSKEIKDNKILYYSIKLVLVNQLLKLSKVTKEEYFKIKIKIEEELNINLY